MKQPLHLQNVKKTADYFYLTEYISTMITAFYVYEFHSGSVCSVEQALDNTRMSH